MEEHIINLDDNIRIVYKHNSFYYVISWIERRKNKNSPWVELKDGDILQSSTIIDHLISHIVFSDIEKNILIDGRRF